MTSTVLYTKFWRRWNVQYFSYCIHCLRSGVSRVAVDAEVCCVSSTTFVSWRQFHLQYAPLRMLKQRLPPNIISSLSKLLQILKQRLSLNRRIHSLASVLWVAAGTDVWCLSVTVPVPWHWEFCVLNELLMMMKCWVFLWRCPSPHIASSLSGFAADTDP